MKPLIVIPPGTLKENDFVTIKRKQLPNGEVYAECVIIPHPVKEGVNDKECGIYAEWLYKNKNNPY